MWLQFVWASMRQQWLVAVVVWREGACAEFWNQVKMVYKVLKKFKESVQSFETILGGSAEFWKVFVVSDWTRHVPNFEIFPVSGAEIWTYTMEMCRDLKWILGVGRSIERACLILKVGSSWSLQIAWVWLCAEFWNDFVVVCRVLKWFQRDVQSSELSKSYKWLKIGSVQRNEKNLWACTEFWNLLIHHRPQTGNRATRWHKLILNKPTNVQWKQRRKVIMIDDSFEFRYTTIMG